MALAEAPGGDEDEQNDILIGEAGQLFRRELSAVGIDLEKDCIRLNGANCFPGRNAVGKLQAPTSLQISCCRKIKVNPSIDSFQPKFILLMGNHALESFWGDQHSDLQITRFRGRAFPDRRTGAWVLPIFHPSFVLRSGGDKNPNMMALWRRDLKRAANIINQWSPPKFRDPEKQIECITDYDRLMHVLDMIQEWANLLVFDYETSGLNPFALGHKIYSVHAVPYIEGQPNKCYSFPLQYPDAWTEEQLTEISKRWCAILRTQRIKKVAHHVQFEDLWSRVILGVLVENWWWCTMNNQHIIDNTPKTTGLKWQAWYRFGIFGYDAEFSRYSSAIPTEEDRKAGKKHVSSHQFNRVHEMPLDRLLLYGGYDGIIGSWLYDAQRKEIKPNSGLDNARNFYREPSLVLVDQQEEGVPVDIEYYSREGEALRQRVDQIGREVMRTREAKLFHQKEGRPIVPTSNDDLKLLLFKHLGLTPTKLTKKENASVDAEVLGSMGLRLTDMLLQMKKFSKVSSTYFNQITREAIDGKVHPHTSLNIARTYRPTINSPNFANLPKRDKETKLLVRRGIRVPPGFKMAQPDYGGIEVHALAWYSEDAELLRYLHDPTTDMHRDQAQQIFKIPSRLWTTYAKEAVYMLRFYTKNRWVFPEYYGSWFDPCAENLWRYCAKLPIGDKKGTTVQQNLGMSLTMFKEHMRQHEAKFWAQFHGVREYQENQIESYRKRGYIETKLGFRYGGWLTRNQLYNYPIQGTAFHLLLWAMTEMHKRSIERNWRSYVMWQVYDAMPIALFPPEQDEVVESINEIMVDKAVDRFPWINTPLKVEVEITGVDGTYADLVEFDESRDRYDYEDEEEGATA